MDVSLSIRSGAAGVAGIPATFPLDRRAVRIGRAAECELVLPDPQNRISRVHCRIDWDGAGHVVTDSSTGGTLVNGGRIDAPYRLRSGDVLTIGDYRLTVEPVRGEVNRGARGWEKPVMAQAQAQTSAMSGTVASPGGDGDAVARLLAAAGVTREALAMPDAAILAASGALLRQLAIGLAVTLSARARARAELGVAPIATEPGNPLLADPPSPTILAYLLRGGPAAAQHANAAFRLAEAHQRATLHAMQGALAKTLETIAPATIRERTKGNDATLWQAYEAAFAGRAGQPGFVETFATELADAYKALADTPADTPVAKDGSPRA